MRTPSLLLAAAFILPVSLRVGAAPTVAILDPDKSDRVPLLEAKLAAEAGPTLVDRAAVEAILKEQQLQAAFGPQGVGERVRLGKVLKADVLVMVRKVKVEKDQALEVVVSETAGGLRLLTRGVPNSSDAKTDVDELLATVRAGLKKFGEQVREVVAVPPFVSQDLTRDMDHLKGAYAKLIEQVIVSRPGTVAVEISEAQALAKELQLASPGAGVQRPLPLYILGDYRHDGKGADQTLRLTLRAERGGKDVATPVRRIVKPGEAAAVLKEWAVSIVGDGPGAAVISDPIVEARQLAARARDFRRLGNWTETVALCEASLLLNPAQSDLRHELIQALNYWIGQQMVPPLDLETYRKAAQGHMRGLDHFTILVESGYVPTASNLPLNLGPPVRGYSSRAEMGTSFRMSPEVTREREQLRAATTDVFRRLMPYALKRCVARELAYYIHRAISPLPTAERFAQQKSYFDQVLDQPAGADCMAVLLVYPNLLPHRPEELSGYLRILESLEERNDPRLKEGLDAARTLIPKLQEQWANRPVVDPNASSKYAQSEIAKKQADPEYGSPPRVVDPAIHQKEVPTPFFQAVRLEMDPPGARLPGRLEGMIPAGQGVDVVWNDGSLFLMSEKGKLREVLKLKGSYPKFSDIAFDGRYVWAAVIPRQGLCTLTVIEVPSGRAWALPTDLLPETRGDMKRLSAEKTLGFRIAPIANGRVCVAGSLGPAWIAIVNFNATIGKADAAIIHESREAQDSKNLEQWKQTTTAYFPERIFTLRGEKPNDVRIIVERGYFMSNFGSRNLEVGLRPLLVDPEKRIATIMEQRLPAVLWANHERTTTNRSVYYCMNAYRERESHLMRLTRVDYPGVIHDLGPVPPGRIQKVVHDGNRFHLYFDARLGDPYDSPANRQPRGEWWVADSDENGLGKAAEKLPQIRALGMSSHYGPVALFDLPFVTLICTPQIAAQGAK